MTISFLYYSERKSSNSVLGFYFRLKIMTCYFLCITQTYFQILILIMMEMLTVMFSSEASENPISSRKAILTKLSATITLCKKKTTVRFMQQSLFIREFKLNFAPFICNTRFANLFYYYLAHLLSLNFTWFHSSAQMAYNQFCISRAEIKHIRVGQYADIQPNNNITNSWL